MAKWWNDFGALPLPQRDVLQPKWTHCEPSKLHANPINAFINFYRFNGDANQRSKWIRPPISCVPQMSAIPRCWIPSRDVSWCIIGCGRCGPQVMRNYRYERFWHAFDWCIRVTRAQNGISIYVQSEWIHFRCHKFGARIRCELYLRFVRIFSLRAVIGVIVVAIVAMCIHDGCMQCTRNTWLVLAYKQNLLFIFRYFRQIFL